MAAEDSVFAGDLATALHFLDNPDVKKVLTADKCGLLLHSIVKQKNLSGAKEDNKKKNQQEKKG